MKHVLIVEDQRMIRETMENYIRQSEDYNLAGSISSAGLAEKLCASRPVDLVLMDVCTENDESGFDATMLLKARFPHIKVIIVTSMLDAGYLHRAKAVGADSIWFKDVSQTELMTVVERTMRGESVYPDIMPEVRIGNASSYEFTDAEIKVLRLLVEGMTYKEMAGSLSVSVETVKSQVGSMLQKTGFTSKTKLAAMVMSKRLIVNGF
ncbi:response regulator transcription factor [uncultured Ruminococcus sp.]|uniref:response regulator transcription factor n=1 Tax=uncultured Ruminococcus sp. TaxID=165186 RepID=UPI0026198A62|nr:response regulator transcription factor [uncultured Ruminococcus sp.]